MCVILYNMLHSIYFELKSTYSFQAWDVALHTLVQQPSIHNCEISKVVEDSVVPFLDEILHLYKAISESNKLMPSCACCKCWSLWGRISACIHCQLWSTFWHSWGVQCRQMLTRRSQTCCQTVVSPTFLHCWHKPLFQHLHLDPVLEAVHP